MASRPVSLISSRGFIFMRIGVLPWVVLLFCASCGGERPVGPVSSPAAKPITTLRHNETVLLGEDWFGIPAWGAAIKEGDLFQVRFWVEAGIMDVNQRLRSVRLSYARYGPAEGQEGFTSLMVAARNGRLSIARYLLDQGADVQALSGTEDTALMWAAPEGSLPMVELLVERGARIEWTNTGGTTALFGACWGGEGQLAIVQYLVSKGARVVRSSAPRRISMRVQITTTPLKSAAFFNEPESLAILAYLIEKGARVNRQNQIGQAALMTAASQGHEDNVRLLVSSGADVHLRNIDGHTAADQARRRGHVAVAAYLDSLMALSKK